MFKQISPQAFKMIHQMDIDGLLSLPAEDVRPLLPSLVRMSLCSSQDSSLQWQEKRKFLLQLLSSMSAVNDIINLLSVDFHELEEDAMKEQQLRCKQGNTSSHESVLLSGLKQTGLLLEFERSEASRRFRIVISELLPLVLKLGSDDPQAALQFPIESELFSSPAYLQEISDVLCIVCAELPSLLQLTIVSEALIYFTNGIQLLSKLIANNSEALPLVCRYMLQTYSKSQTSSTNGKSKAIGSIDQKKIEALLELCRLHPECSYSLRNHCVQTCQLPELAVQLTLDYIGSIESTFKATFQKKKTVVDIVAFASGLLLGNDSKVRSWFATYLRRTKDQVENPLRNAFVKELIAVVKTTEVESNSESVSAFEGSEESVGLMNLLLNEHCMRASALIRLFCALKAIAGVKFSEEEGDLLLRLITCFPPLTPAGIRFVSLALGMLLTCPSLLVSVEQEKKVISWIRWLASRSSELENVGPEGCSFAEQLLLTAIHLHGDRHAAALQLACSTLGMRIKVSSSSLTKLRHIFTEDVFPTQVVAAHAMKIPVTKGINSSMNGYLPVHCIYQLLKTRAFSQGKIPVKEWIFKQICTAEAPLHPQMQPLISQYVTTIVTPFTAGNNASGHTERHLNDPLEEAKILHLFGIDIQISAMDSLFECKSTYSLTSQLLMLYYVLLYEDAVLNNMKTLALLPQQPKRYSASLLNQIPVELLVFKAQKNSESCQGLYPALLGLLTTHLPHLCLVEDWMQDLDGTLSSTILSSAFTSKNKDSKSINFTPNQLYEGLRQSIVNPAPALMHLQQLSQPNVPADQVIMFADSLTRGLPFVLTEKVSRRVRQEAQKVWFKLNSVIPRKLWVFTIHALQPSWVNSCNKTPFNSRFPINITFDDFLDDPLLPLTVDKRVLRCPELLAIVLRILTACLSACRSQASVLLKAHPTIETKSSVSARSVSPLGNASVTENEKEELRAAFTAAQTSAAVQLLIEICLLDDEISLDVPEKTVNLISYKREVQCLVCSTLHQMFIENPNVAKLVHFQGYPSKLVSVLVAGVPSMHICLDFVPELLQQSNPSKQLFGIELASQLCLQYPLPKSFSIARLCVNVIATQITVLSSGQRCSYFERTLPSLPSFTKSFPPLLQESISILQQLGRVIHSYVTMHYPHTSTDYLSSDEDWSFDNDSPFLDKIDSASNNASSSFDPHMKLYLNVRKTFYNIVEQTIR